MKRTSGGPKRRTEPGEAAVTVEALVLDPENRRRHTPRNRDMIVRSLRETGAARSIVLDEGNVVLAGNGVVDAATEAGISTVRIVDAAGDELIAVRRSGLTPEQKRSLAIFDNRTAELAEWDVEQLARDLRDGHDLSAFFTEQELEKLIGSGQTKAGLTDPDFTPAVRATTIVTGDLFALGDHRLLCGDATNQADVVRLLEEEIPPLMVTDPPYGVAYDPSWRAEAGVNKNRQKMGTVTNDDRADWREAWRHFPGAVAYVWHGGLKSAVVQESLEAEGFVMRAQIIWAKDRLALSRGDYHWQHEPCWYAVRAGATGRRTEDRTQSTLWRIADGMASTIWEIPAREDDGHTHGTQKPVECMARAMRNHLARSVYDPFVGSGTSIIAAERLGRRCFALELEPRYVQVTIDRWEAFTGGTAQAIARG